MSDTVINAKIVFLRKQLKNKVFKALAEIHEKEVQPPAAKE